MDTNTLLQKARQFHQQGYLLLKNVLPPERVERIAKAADEMVTKHEEEKQNYAFFGCIRQHIEFQSLIDEPSVLPLVVNILGYNIQIYMSHLSVNYPYPEGTDLPAEEFSKWHMDGPRPAPPGVGGVIPVQSLKVCYLLSDLTEPGRGNTKIIPGSHQMPDYAIDSTGTGKVANEMEVCGEAGDAFLFAQNTWHSVSVNRSQLTRKLLFLGYNYTWMRRLDQYTSDDIIGDGNPMRRQLLGDMGDQKNAFYFANEKNLPLEKLHHA